MATNDTSSTPDTPDTPDTPVTPPPANTAPAAKRSSAGKAFAITGIAVGSVVLLGLTFAAGVGVGRWLPDRGPGGISAIGSHSGDKLELISERIEQRMDERAENRDDRRALFEQWLEEQGIDPMAPGEPAEPTE